MPTRSVVASVVFLAGALLAGCTDSVPSQPVAAPSQSATVPSQPVAVPSAGAVTQAPVPSPAAGRRLPPANAVFDYQIGGAYAPASNVGIVDRDRHDLPVPGRYNICYINAFQTQPGENDWWKRNHDGLLLRYNGGYLEDPNWPGELILDLSTPAKRQAIAAVVDEWIAGCAGKGYQAIEPDNLDSWTRSHGILTQAHALEFAKLIAAYAHRRGLAIAQKNTPELGQAGKRAGFDFAIAEECAVFDECGEYTAVFGDHVIQIEYTDNPRRHYDQACASHGKRISVILRDRNVVPAGNSGYHHETC